MEGPNSKHPALGQGSSRPMDTNLKPISRAEGGREIDDKGFGICSVRYSRAPPSCDLETRKWIGSQCKTSNIYVERYMQAIIKY